MGWGETARSWLPLAGALALGLGCETAPPPPAETAVAPAPPAQPPAPTPGPMAPDAPSVDDPAPFQAPDADGWGRAGSLRYLEVMTGGAAREARLPMIVMIHGLGDRPRHDWFGELPAPTRMILPQAPIPYHGGFSWFTYRVRDGDPTRLADGIARAADLLAEAIAILARERPTEGKPIVGGFSQGGMLSYALALRHGGLTSLALPISGLLPRPLWPETRGEAPPIRALHGTADAVVPHAPAEALVEHLSRLGYDAELELFEGVGHQISPLMARRLSATLIGAVRSPVTRGAAARSKE